MLSPQQKQTEESLLASDRGAANRAQAERLTEAEARAVVALWAERQTGQELESVFATPTLADIAEGLGTSSQEADDLLREVRTRGLHIQAAESAHEARLVLCHRCDSEMEPGEVVDQTYGAMTGQMWVPGKVKTNWLGMLKTPSRQVKTVVTYCCPTCGLLESFARTP